jgi:hypothetical protein
MERVGLHVMFYYYSACLHFVKTKENFSIVGVIYYVLFTSDNVPDGIKNATHNTFSKLKYPVFFSEMAKHKQEII